MTLYVECMRIMQILMTLEVLQAAMNNMTNELMLLGVATLILSAIERDTARICSASSLPCAMPPRYLIALQQALFPQLVRHKIVCFTWMATMFHQRLHA